MSEIKKFALNAGILTATSLSLGALGVLYNAWLTRNLGAEGTGLFSLMMAVYRFSVAVACSGSGLAATRLVAEENTSGSGKGAAFAMRQTLFYSLFCGVSAGILLWAASGFAAKTLVGNIIAAKPFRVLAFSLPFVGVSAALTGYFTAVTRVASSSAAQIFEQLSQMAFTLFVFGLLKPDSLEKACILVAAGSAVSEGAAFLLHWYLYKRDRKKNPFKKLGTTDFKGINKRLAGIAVPVGASAVLRQALSTIKHLMVPTSFMKSGMTEEKALSEYGVIGGMALPILLFPCAFLLGFSNLLVPEVTKLRELGQYRRIDRVINLVFRVTLIFSCGTAAVLMHRANELATLMYGEPAAARAILVLAPTVTVMYLDSAVDGILKGLGEQAAVVQYNVYDTALCLLMVLTVVPKFGALGYLATIALSEAMNMALSASRLIYVTGFKFRAGKWAAIPAVCAVLSTLFSDAVLGLCGASAKTAGGLALSVLIMVAAYIAVLTLCKCITKEDMRLIGRLFGKDM